MNTTPQNPNVKNDSSLVAQKDNVSASGKNENANEVNSLQEIIKPLVDEVKMMRESLHKDISAMDKKIEDALQVQQIGT